MSRPSTWGKPRHHAGTEAQKNFAGRGGTTPKNEGGQMSNIFGARKGKKLARRKRRRG